MARLGLTGRGKKMSRANDGHVRAGYVGGGNWFGVALVEVWRSAGQPERAQMTEAGVPARGCWGCVGEERGGAAGVLWCRVENGGRCWHNSDPCRSAGMDDWSEEVGPAKLAGRSRPGEVGRTSLPVSCGGGRNAARCGTRQNGHQGWMPGSGSLGKQRAVLALDRGVEYERRP